MTSGSSASIGCVRIGVAERADCCGRGAKGGTAPNVGWDGGGFTACEVDRQLFVAWWHMRRIIPEAHRALGIRFRIFRCRRLIHRP